MGATKSGRPLARTLAEFGDNDGWAQNYARLTGRKLAQFFNNAGFVASHESSNGLPPCSEFSSFQGGTFGVGPACNPGRKLAHFTNTTPNNIKARKLAASGDNNGWAQNYARLTGRKLAQFFNNAGFVASHESSNGLPPCSALSNFQGGTFGVGPACNPGRKLAHFTNTTHNNIKARKML